MADHEQAFEHSMAFSKALRDQAHAGEVVVSSDSPHESEPTMDAILRARWAAKRIDPGGKAA